MVVYVVDYCNVFRLPSNKKKPPIYIKQNIISLTKPLKYILSNFYFFNIVFPFLSLTITVSHLFSNMSINISGMYFTFIELCLLRKDFLFADVDLFCCFLPPLSKMYS